MGFGGRTGFHKKIIDVQVGGGGTGYNSPGSAQGNRHSWPPVQRVWGSQTRDPRACTHAGRQIKCAGRTEPSVVWCTWVVLVGGQVFIAYLGLFTVFKVFKVNITFFGMAWLV